MRLLRTLRLRRTCRKLFSTKQYSRDTAALTDFHNIPLSDDEMGFRTRLSRLSKEMLDGNRVGIRCLSRVGFRLLDGTFLLGPIAVFPNTVLSWRVATPDDITAESVEFFTLLEPKLDVLVVGVGDRKDVDAVRRRIAPILMKNRVGFEVMDTEEAIPTLNFLNSEYRCAAGAFYPPAEMLVTDEEHSKAMSLLRPYDTVDVNPLLGQTSFSEKRDLVRKIWGYEGLAQLDELEEAQKRFGKELNEGDLDSLPKRMVVSDTSSKPMLGSNGSSKGSKEQK